MRIVSVAAAALVAGVLGGHAAHAGFLNDTVNGSYFFPDTGSLFANDGNQVVSPSASFFFATGTPNTTVVVTDTQITQTFDVGGGSYSPASFNGAVITDLTSSNITGVTVDAATNLLGFSAADVSFTSNSVSINIQNLSVPSASDQIVLDVFGGAVPEPFSLSLLGAGLIGLGVARRRRRV